MPDEVEGLHKLGHEGVGYTHTRFEYPDVGSLEDILPGRYFSLIKSAGLTSPFNKGLFADLDELGQSKLRRSSRKISKMTTKYKVMSLKERFKAVNDAFTLRYDTEELASRTALVSRSYLDYAFVDTSYN